MLGVDPLVDQPPNGGHRGDRTVLGLLIDEMADPGQTIGAVRDRRGQIGEHPTRVMQPRTLERIRQHFADLRRQTRQVSDLPQQPNPGMRNHPDAVSGNLQAGICSRLGLTLVLFTLKVPNLIGPGILHKIHCPLRDRHFHHFTPRVAGNHANYPG